MINPIHSAETGKINVAPNALALSQERYYEVLRGVDGVMRATRNLPAKTPPKDVVALSLAEKEVQPVFDAQFNGIVADMQQSVSSLPTEQISLKDEAHPNQAAIDEAFLLAMQAHENNDSQDPRV